MKTNKLFKKVFSRISKAFISVKKKDTSFFILVLCVCIISTSIIWTYSKKNSELPDDISFEDEYGDDEIDPSDISDATSMADDEYVTSTDKPVEPEDLGPDLYSISAPIAGVVVKQFSIDRLVYFDTLKEWRVHTGIDIAPDDALSVSTAYTGVVEKVNTNSLMGIEVIIDHGGGVKTLYSCLSSCKVKEGDEVEQGVEIGAVGNYTGIEMADGPHLHFEIMINGENKNPLDYFPNEEN